MSKKKVAPPLASRARTIRKKGGLAALPSVTDAEHDARLDDAARRVRAASAARTDVGYLVATPTALQLPASVMAAFVMIHRASLAQRATGTVDTYFQYCDASGESPAYLIRTELSSPDGRFTTVCLLEER